MIIQSCKRASIYNTSRKRKRMSYLMMRCRMTMTVYYQRKASMVVKTFTTM